MATDFFVSRVRRRLLFAAATGLAWPLGAAAKAAFGASRNAEALATAWDDAAGRHHVGVVQLGPGAATVRAAIEVPTRAHGLAFMPDGSLLAIARRPGEWLLRWHPGQAPVSAQWRWAAPDRHFSGHVLVAPGRRAVYTTEIDSPTGAGLLVQRHPKTLMPQAVWPTYGLDPHDMQWLPAGRLLVANGGIATREETGRAKLEVDRMDPSLVCLDARSGRLEGQWRLPDSRLSIRHLARHASGVVGVALQSEHAQADERAAAPLLALWDPDARTLRCAAARRPTSGYAGDVTALADGWAVSCPRDDAIALYSLDGASTVHLDLASACALASDGAQHAAWAVGRELVMPIEKSNAALRGPIDGWRPDNHAVLV